MVVKTKGGALTNITGISKLTSILLSKIGLKNRCIFKFICQGSLVHLASLEIGINSTQNYILTVDHKTQKASCVD